MCVLETAVLALALNMYHEARGEGPKAMMAVAEVTMNRVESEHFPDNVCDVVYQGTRVGNKPTLNKCQFSWYCDGESDKMRDEEYKILAEVLAVDYLTGLDTNFTKDATHYHATYVYPYWASSLTKTSQVGSHVFYK